jgi:O-antigen/teichoic acid export membrane protein
VTTDNSVHLSARRIARNLGARLAGELVGKVASLLFFVAIARKLGTTDYGDFAFALALTGTLILASGLGTDSLVAREVARSHERLDEFMGNVVALKLVTSALAVLAAAGIAYLGNYGRETQIAVVLLGIGVSVENLGRTWAAAFQAFERMEFISISLTLQRTLTAAAAIAVLYLGGTTPEAMALVYLAGSAIGLVVLTWSLPRFLVAPRWRFDRAQLLPLMRAGIPIGLAGLLFTFLLRLDTVLLSFLKSGDNTQVGVYGAAFRLVEATMFLSWALGAAMLPWLARQSAAGDTQLARGYELGLKAVTALLVPAAVATSLLAAPIVSLLYGDQYDPSVTPLRILGPLSVLYAINYLTAVALTAHDRPGLFTRLFGIVTFVNLGLNLALIPPYGARGAAISAVGSGLVLALLSLRQAHRALGAINLWRAFASPLAGGAAGAAVVYALGFSLVPSLLLGGVAYVAGLVLFERLVFPKDFRFLFGLARRPIPAGAAVDPPPGPESLAP